MFQLEYAVALLIFVALNIYVLSGGADFGGGVWNLFAWGPRKKAQRDTIAEAIAPIWEANHVWLIFVIVVLFVAFPRAFATISIALHIPLFAVLLGIVFRGSAFVFRSYDQPRGVERRRWVMTFAVASVITPVMLGVNVGALASGRIRVDSVTGHVSTDFFSAWLTPFSFAIGFFALALFAFLAAVYLTLESENEGLREDFRLRGLWSGLVVIGLAVVCLLLAREGAPSVWLDLSRQWWSIPFQLLTGLVALGAMAGLWLRRYALARILAMVQTSLILWGWGLAQSPYLVVPDLSIMTTPVPPQVLRALLVVVAVGAVILLPSLWFLYSVFKGKGRAGFPSGRS